MDKNTNITDFEYTIVMDPKHPISDTEKETPKEETPAQGAAQTGAASAPQTKPEAPKQTMNLRDLMDRLYYEYERMCLKEPTILDRDDAYPHSYQWRMGGRYDPEKKDVLIEAIKLGKKISDTEAYERYVAEVKNRKFNPESWD